MRIIYNWSWTRVILILRPSNLSQTLCSWGCSTKNVVTHSFNDSVTDPLWKYLHSTVYPKPKELGSWNFERMFTPKTCVTCHVSHVRCQVSGVRCQVTGAHHHWVATGERRPANDNLQNRKSTIKQVIFGISRRLEATWEFLSMAEGWDTFLAVWVYAGGRWWVLVGVTDSI